MALAGISLMASSSACAQSFALSLRWNGPEATHPIEGSWPTVRETVGHDHDGVGHLAVDHGVAEKLAQGGNAPGASVGPMQPIKHRIAPVGLGVMRRRHHGVETDRSADQGAAEGFFA